MREGESLSTDAEPPGDCHGSGFIREIREEFAANDRRARATYVEQKVRVEGEITALLWDRYGVTVKIAEGASLFVGAPEYPEWPGGLLEHQYRQIERDHQRHLDQYNDWMMEASVGDKVKAVCTIAALEVPTRQRT